MCGVFFIYDQNKSGAGLEAATSGVAFDRLQHRGPNGASSEAGDQWFALHSLLSITGSTRQPCAWRDGIFLFNGEIYNDWQRYDETYGDAAFLTSFLNEHGTDGIRDLDGEFALIVLDEKAGILHVVSDTFGTKPLYLALEDGRVGAASYDYILAECGFTAPVRCRANSWVQVDLKTQEVIADQDIRTFDFVNATTDSYEPFAQAFNRAVRKRTDRVRHGIYVPLSSGHDSGLIAAELEANGTGFTAYGFEYAEIPEIMQARYSRLGARDNIDAILLTPSMQELDAVRDELMQGIPAFSLVVDPSAPPVYANPDIRQVSGYIAAAYIAKTASAKGQIVSLSGQGVDEIISDYYNVHTNSRRSYLRGDWTKATAPWPNFFGGWNKVFLEASERIVGHYGVETRYPFLDPEVIQSFLNLTPELKGRKYKGCLAYRLDQLEFPYHDRKIGFTGFAA